MSIIAELVQGGITGILNSFSNAARVFKADATQGAVLDEAVDKLKADLLTLAMQVESKAMEAVNASIQAELTAKSEHWIQWAWRPLNGMVLAFGSLSAVLITMYAAVVTITGVHPEALGQIPAIVNSVAMVLAIPGAVCGVTAWYRGQTQLENSKK